MTKVLLTAFQPYDDWQANASWLALVELTREFHTSHSVTTRLYPFDYDQVVDRLGRDINDKYDYVVMTGQAPGQPRIEIETVALNIATEPSDESAACRQLIPGGPLAYASSLPADAICRRIREAGIPAGVSRQGGTFLCNATLYLALHRIAEQSLSLKATFVHVPLETSQVARLAEPIPSLPATTSAHALRVLLETLPTSSERA